MASQSFKLKDTMFTRKMLHLEAKVESYPMFTLSMTLAGASEGQNKSKN